MTKQLQRVLLLLVLLNLVFVWITNAVSLHWMAPLVVLTCAAPYLSGLQQSLLYRSVWNVALLAIFGLLVVDVRATGIRYMLEDGLILAAFCQVHVLNNLAKQHRPDLMFFNSFLIALVTGFFCQDVVYSLVFVVYSLVLIVGLAVASASTVGRLPTRVLDRDELRTTSMRGVRLAGTTLFFTALVFAFFPRDFDREGLVDEELMESQSAPSEVAFSDQIRLDRKNNVQVSRRVVITATLNEGSHEDVPTHWRGATFTRLTRYGWTADTNPLGPFNRNRQVDDPWRPLAGQGYVRFGYEAGPKLDVVLDDKRAQHLFMPADTHRVQYACAASPNIDGTFRISRHGGAKIRYSLMLNAPGDGLRKHKGPPEDDHLHLHPRLIPKGLRAWNEEVRRRISPTGTRREVVETIRTYVEGAREYVLPGEDGAADNLEGFLAGRGGGHCEYFATALVVLLRLNKVPCRMVSGYVANEWDETGKTLTIRANHAHAWVEVWDAQRGWYLVDPTPAQSAMADAEESIWSAIGGFFERSWAAVTSFDGKQRAALLAWAKDQLVIAWTFARTNPLTTALLIAALLFLRHRWRTRAKRRMDPDVRDYLGVLARLKLELKPGETPRQLLARAELTPERRELLATATAQHEAARYQ